MEPKIIFEDEYLMALDKPAGWIVNEAQTTHGQKVVQEWLRKLNYPLAKVQQLRSGIVHRLDKETSGVLLVAKTKEMFAGLQSQFKRRTVKKSYLALLHGTPALKEGKIIVPVGRLPWRRDRFGVLPGGRESETLYKVQKFYKKNDSDFSLVEFYPKTGRTHQIRIHAKYLGHPIVSDDFYAGRKTNRDDRVWCPRLFLHANHIEFIHPKANKLIEIDASLPPDLFKVLTSLRQI